MKAKNLVLLLPWHSVDLVRCKTVVDVFNTVVDPNKEKFAQRLQLQIAFEEVDCLEEFTNIGLFCKTSARSSNRNSCANIGRNFKSCYLTESQFVSKKETNCSLEPVGIEMTSNEGGGASSLTSGLSYKLQQDGGRNSSEPPEERPASGTPSLAALDSETASGAVSPGAVAHSPGAVAHRARGFQPQTVFDNRRPALRLALANPTEQGRSHDAGEKASGRGRLMRADNVSPRPSR